MIKEPPRLLEGESGDLGEELAALRGRLPSAERMAALAERLSAAGAGVASPPPNTPLELVEVKGPRPANAVPSGAKLVVVALIAGGALVAGALWWRRPDPAAAVPSHPAPTAAPSIAGGAAAGVRAPETMTLPTSAAATTPKAPAALAGTARPALAGTAAGLGIAPAPVAPTPVTNSPGASALPPEPHPAKVALLDSARSPSAPSARVEHEPSHVAPKATAGHVDTPITGGPLAENTVVVSEVELLKRARSALAADPVAALGLTEQCRAQYPNGGFAQERDFIAISALLRMGRAGEARSRVSLFKMHYPGSPYLARLGRMMGDE